MILIIDFGSQVTHLISRRFKEIGVKIEIVDYKKAIGAIEKKKPIGIILSGGPSSVYSKNAPIVSKEIYNFNIPILGICYGLQLTAKLLGGKVVPGKKEYGPTALQMANSKWQIANGLPKTFTVWMSHGDEVVSLPEGFEVLGSTKDIKTALVADLKRKIYGVQFHPEADHTEYGNKILENFAEICNAKIKINAINIEKIEKEIKNLAKGKYVIGAVSGGVDSTVAAVLTAKAIGKKFIPIFVDNGLMRDGTREHVEKIFKHIGVNVDIVDAKKETLKKLKGVIDPEEKRKIIGNLYISLFEKEMIRFIKSGKEVAFLMQGTIYSDVIESKGSKNSANIKSHHNVGGLPKNMKLKLIEPVRNFYKDEVREIGKRLGLPIEFIQKQPFPGPGYAVRIRGEVTKDRLLKQRIADNIILEELGNANVLHSVFQSFPVLTGAYSTAVKGDGRNFGEVVALRIIESKDIMTSTWARLPYDVLQKISSRIVNEVPDISRVVYDITTKPPATMEWE
ncbi:glutamine-hydrolyzing GMP synthase [Patescibacteria group bacterium]|nr:glutamine-hydrolyzing GMP synthase [Patescibacteria group bacterium]